MNVELWQTSTKYPCTLYVHIVWKRLAKQLWHFYRKTNDSGNIERKFLLQINFKTYPLSPNAPSNWIDKKSTKSIVYQKKCNYLITNTLAHTLFKLWKSFGILYDPVYINVIPWRRKLKGKGNTYQSFYLRPQFISIPIIPFCSLISTKNYEQRVTFTIST